MKISHIFHSGFMVEMEESTLLFDWYTGTLPVIRPDRKLYVFCSHSHGDHYSQKIWDLQKTHPDIIYILDEGIPDVNRHPEADVLPVRPGMTYPVSGMRIMTLESTDMGVAFYVETEGKRIYHAGDLNVWFWNDEPMEDNIASEKKCREEMQSLADRLAAEEPAAGDRRPGNLVDVAFVPLDPRLEEHAPRCLAAFMEILGAPVVFPMHYWERESEVKGYLSDDRIRPFADRLCFEKEVVI